ncbi:MAG TPA: histidine kinase dimerization/phospho-acceptor domain-containing protein, partial [Alphaproteobacteria bacterium]|nr:histidine kinase dimerization/phospho-acceptor domain-containing protein [Alphaproteobacteria bacterium]
MSRTIVPPHRLALATIFLALPSVLILGWLWWGGAIDPKLAAGLGLLALLHGGAVVAFYWRDVAAVTQYLHRLRDGTRDAALPAVRSSMVRPMVAAVAQLHRGWQRRLDSCQATRLASEGVIEALPEPLLVIDQGRKVVRGNAAARHLFGSRLLERDLAEGLRSPAVLDAVDAVLREGGGRQVEFTLTGPADRIFAALVEPFVADGEEGVRSVVVSLHDITAIRRSEKMHADFVANASHELRTPLSAMLGFIETLRGPAKDDPEAQGRFLGIMHQQASRMSRLIADLLSLSRIELHEHNPPTARVDLAELARNAAAAFELKAAARRIRLRLDIPDALPEVVADEDQMTQVVQNLIDNAIKYSREST